MSLPDGAYEYVSPAASRVFGYSSKEFFDDPFLIRDIIHPGYIDYFQKEWSALIEGKVRPIFEYKIIGPEGNDRWIVQSNIGVFDRQGNIIAIEGICRNVTEQKRAEEALKDEAIRRRILIEGSRDGIVVLDQNGKVYEANHRYADMLGYSMEEVHQLHVWDWDTQWTQGKLMEKLQTVDETGDHYETRHRRKDGTFYDVEISTNGAVCAGQKLIFCVCRDITDRKQAEEALRISRENLLAESNQRKILSKRLIELLENDRHEIAMELHDNIGQILTSLKINLEIIDDKLIPTGTELGTMIKVAEKRVSQAIKGIKDISHGLMPGILDVLGLLPSLQELFNEYIEHTDIKIDFFNRNVPKRFDKEKELAIYRIVQEALNNVTKHAKAKHVYVSLLKKGEVISLSVEDDGVGFDSDKEIRITKRKLQLGLLIIQERAIQLGGKFTIESQPGKGTHLLVEIPG
jgi:PAS domain S-box-containing protein